MFYHTFHTIIGPITVVEENEKLIQLTLEEKEIGEEKQTPILKKTEKEIIEYLEGTRKEFTIPLEIKGTKFQEEVWAALTKIPYGKTVTYQEIAQQTEKKKAYRAVGNGVHNNPIPIIIPCHRVISKNGTLGGYRFGTSIKEKLLEIEKQDE